MKDRLLGVMKIDIKDSGWNFDNSYARLPQSFFTRQNPNPVSSPEIMVFNVPLADALGLKAGVLESGEGAQIFAGNDIPDGAEPLAQAYAGHQFGHFTMLGDGRAILLGEQITPQGGRFDIQLKGSGRTRYSRGGDGRAALGPMLREYIISEAMHALGIPTTRSLAVVTTGETILRETELPGAILTRVAASHLRVGTFEYAANFRPREELQSLADYAIKRHYSDIENGENKYLSLLREVIKRQAALIAKWQLVGFIHGVMNTDNMTISGETIDYGPCAFMDAYDPATVFSSIDTQGRYAYGNQPYIGGWNLARFAETLLPLFHEKQEQAVEIAQEAIGEYSEYYQKNWLAGMREKLGLFTEESGDEALIQDLLTIMQRNQADFTNTFRALALEDSAISGNPAFTAWYEKWRDRLGREKESKEESIQLMKTSNPAVIPRNHRVEEALEAAVEHGDLTVLEKLLEVLRNPFENHDEHANYCEPAPQTARPYRTFCGT